MTRLIAVTPIPGIIQIEAGQEFIENDPDQAQVWVRTGQAKYKIDPAVLKVKLNSRGWDALHWDGASVAILASGESLSEEQCVAVYEWRAKAPNRYVIVINTTFRRALWADILYACDGAWWKTRDDKTGQTYYEEAVQSFKGQLWTQDPVAARELKLNYIVSQKGSGLSKSPRYIMQNANGGFQAINLAYLAGAQRIYLFGFDCKGGHWHGDHPAGINSRLPHTLWLQHAKVLAGDLRDAKVTVMNCSPGTALRCFPQVKTEVALNES